MNPFGLARWFLDKLGYWLVWSVLFSMLMLLLTSVFGGSKLAVTVFSFFSFWGTASAMDYLREKARFWE